MLHSTESHYRPCNCRSVGECRCNAFAEGEAIDALVNAFAETLRAKLHRKMYQGRYGWDDPEWPRDEILARLRENLRKGDMVDVAAFAMFAWNQEKSPMTPIVPPWARKAAEALFDRMPEITGEAERDGDRDQDMHSEWSTWTRLVAEVIAEAHAKEIHQ